MSGAALLLKYLGESGYIEGQNLILERRFAERQPDRLAALARELVEARPDIIVAVGDSSTRAARNATLTIPIVMGFGVDPVGQGFVKTLATPGGNVTGVAYWAARGFDAKRLELLKEAVPRATRIAYLAVPGQSSRSYEEAHTAASSLGIKLVVVEVDRLPALAAELVQAKVDVIVAAGPRAISAARESTPTIPVVFVYLADPVAAGFVSSLAHPGGNLTGTASEFETLITKQLQLLKEAVPQLS